jgi:hypothetical protein
VVYVNYLLYLRGILGGLFEVGRPARGRASVEGREDRAREAEKSTTLRSETFVGVEGTWRGFQGHGNTTNDGQDQLTKKQPISYHYAPNVL